MKRFFILTSFLVLIFIVVSFGIIFPNLLITIIILILGTFSIFLNKKEVTFLVTLSFIVLTVVELSLNLSFIEYILLQLFLVLLFHNLVDFMNEYKDIVEKLTLKYTKGFLYNLTKIFSFSILFSVLFINIGVFLGVPGYKTQFILLYLIIFLVFLALVIKSSEK